MSPLRRKSHRERVYGSLRRCISNRALHWATKLTRGHRNDTARSAGAEPPHEFNAKQNRSPHIDCVMFIQFHSVQCFKRIVRTVAGVVHEDLSPTKSRLDIFEQSSGGGRFAEIDL